MAADKVLQRSGTQPLHTYLERRQAKVGEWVALRPIFDVCARDTSYEGDGKLRVPCWRQAAAEKQLRPTLYDIFAATRE